MIVSSPDIPREPSDRISALRFILVALVVFIHNDFTSENLAGHAVVFCQSPFGAWLQKLVSQGMARGAVPLFFLFAGYLQTRKNDPYPVLLKKRARSLLVPFCLWMGIYAACFSAAKLLAAKFAPHLVAHSSGSSAFPYSASEWFHNFLGYELKPDGTFSNPGFAIQFWFVRDLVILVALSPVLRWLLAKCPVFLFTLSGMAFLTPFPVFVNSQALFFYLGGMWCARRDFNFFEKADAIPWLEISIVFLLSFGADEIFFARRGPLHGLAVLSACVALLKLSAFLVRSRKTLAVLSWLGGFSFFLFAIHAPILNTVLQKTWIHFFPMRNAFFALFEYFGVAFFDIVLGTGIGIAMKKLAPAAFGLLNGGRR